jgi:hypothetical protein
MFVPPKLLPTCAKPTPIIDRTLPGHLRVYASTLPQADQPSSKPERITREIAISIRAGSLKAPGKIERLGRRKQTSFDETMVKDEEFSIEDLGMVLMEEPEDMWPHPVCNGSCHRRMKVVKGGDASGATVVRLMSRFLTFMVLDEIAISPRFNLGLALMINGLGNGASGA